ncbi:MAG TPA: energy-coupling factor transporter transmembrane component T [Solirubrobacterales bacterium]|nr:energy-coupling factor transporter transmembrane component T [Solirubrobacterales bacterium]
MRSALAYTPRAGRLQAASVPAAAVFIGSIALVAFVFSSPAVLSGAAAAVAVAGLAAGAGRALAVSLRWGLWLGLVIVAVNVLVGDRGDTVLVRGYELPVIGPMDVTLESLVAGVVLAERIVVVTMAFAVWSACVDPDRVLRVIRPLARRSALTATLVSRMVPLAAADLARLREAAMLRGPVAAPAGNAALARRLVGGSLDRAMDVAATLELRGYALDARSAREPVGRSRHDRRFLAAGLAIAAIGMAARLVGVGGFDPYPAVEIDLDPATIAIAAALPVLARCPFGWRDA